MSNAPASPAAAIERAIRNVPDFPKPGIQFKDITPVLADPRLFCGSIDLLIDHFKPGSVDAVVGIDARGFIFAAPMAIELNAGFVPVRKPGKLPFDRHSFRYDLEYGSDTLEMHSDAVSSGDRVLIVDDVLATGGTARAACDVVRELGASVVGLGVVIELSFLSGREPLEGTEVFSVIGY